MLSLAEVRINLTIPVLSAGHLKALHDGLGETEARGKEHFLPPSSSPGPVPSSLLPGTSRSGARLPGAHGPRTGGAGWGSPGCGRSSRNGSCPWPADPASRACWCSAACSPAASSGPAAAAGSQPAQGHRESSAQSSSLWAPQQCLATQDPSRRVLPPGPQRLLPAVSGIWLGSRSWFPGGEARQGLGAVSGERWSDRGSRVQRDVGLGWKGMWVYGICLIVKPEPVCDGEL